MKITLLATIVIWNLMSHHFNKNGVPKYDHQNLESVFRVCQKT